MQTGSFFTQGSTHMVCEDYALNGVDYAIVSDGCSNGGGPRIHTDFGSRLLAKAAEEHLLKINGPFELFMQAVCSTAQTQQRSFPNLPVDCLTATLLTAVFHEGLFKVNVVGDGLVAARKKDKTWEIRSYDFVPGGETGKKAPYYLKYDMMNQRQEYFRLFGGVLEESVYSGPLAEATEFTSKTQVDMKATDKVYVDLTFPINEYDLVCICSDGISSFYEMVKTATSKHKAPVHVLEVLKILLDFSDEKAGFVERQCNWVFKRDVPNTFLRKNWAHSDDVSIAAVFCG